MPLCSRQATYCKRDVRSRIPPSILGRDYPAGSTPDRNIHGPARGPVAQAKARSASKSYPKLGRGPRSTSAASRTPLGKRRPSCLSFSRPNPCR